MTKSIPGNHGRPRRSRPFQVDGRDYAVTIATAGLDAEENVQMRATIRAQFGSRSVCIVRGLTSRAYWLDYPNVDTHDAGAISITPQAVCVLIRHARQHGWDPEGAKSNFELRIDNDEFRTLMTSL